MQAGALAASTGRRSSARVRATILCLAVAGALVVAPMTAFAGGGSSVWVVTGGGAAPTTAVQFGSAFVVGYRSSERQPWAHARCYANATTVLSGAPAPDGSIWGSWYSLWAGGPSPQNFVLGASVSPVWVGGGADCIVDLVKVSGKYLGANGFSNQTVLASTRFSATQ